MKINSVSIGNILSFGPQKQIISDFTKFNLFIGRNGAGKTNLQRVLGNLIVEPANRCSTGEEQFWQLQLDHNYQSNRSVRYNATIGDLIIDIDYERFDKKEENIIFKNGINTSGDISWYKRVTKLIEPNSNLFDLGTKLEKLQEGYQLAILNFGLKEIFNLEISISPGGLLSEFYTSPEGSKTLMAAGDIVRFDRQKWPSGFAQVASILFQFISGHNGHLLFIDEPEISLEPIRCRYLIRFLFWLTLRKNDLQSLPQYAKALVEDYSCKWDSWISPQRKRYKMENAENDFRGITCEQLFISSHAPHLIQEFLSLNEIASIYEFNLEWQDNSIYPERKGIMGKLYSTEQKQTSLFSCVRKVNSGVAKILDNIGANGSDLLQSNGIVWVEGPSDIIYISKWIEMYCNEKNIPVPVKGIDYQFQMFGGTLLNNICITTEDLSEEEENQKLVEMFSFSRNAYVVIDSDAWIKKEGDDITDKSKFEKAKNFIADQFESLSEFGFNVGLWYDKRNTEITTIEDHIDTSSIEKVGMRGNKSKVQYAYQIVSTWDSEKKLEEFKGDLKLRVEDIVNHIRLWNTLPN